MGQTQRCLTSLLGKKRPSSAEPAGPSQSKISRQTHSEKGNGWKKLGKGSAIGYWPRLVKQHVHDEALQELQKEAPWRRTEVTIFGKRVMQPREICYMADSQTLGYKYSGTEMIVEPWHKCMLPLKQIAEETAGVKFNSCLLNKYNDGQEYMGWHSDDESMYGKDAPICAISLGHGRDFKLREKANHKNMLTYTLGQGDVFVMMGSTQTYWQHSVPKRPKVASVRISLTFRFVKFPVGGSVQR